jgi:hypothetical protein
VIEPRICGSASCRRRCAASGFQVIWNADTRQEEVHLEGAPLLPFGIVGVGMAGRPFDDIGKGVRYSELMPGGSDPRRRLVDMDAEGIDIAVLYPSIGLFLEAIQDPALAEASCRVYNDWLADYCLTDAAASPASPRFRCRTCARRCASCAAPAASSACAAPSSGRTRARRGRCTTGTSIPSGRAAAEMGVPIGLHPSGAGDLPGAFQGLRLDAPIMGHPSIFFIDNYIGFSHLVCGGVLERHPNSRSSCSKPAAAGWRTGSIASTTSPRSTSGWRPTCTPSRASTSAASATSRSTPTRRPCRCSRR